MEHEVGMAPHALDIGGKYPLLAHPKALKSKGHRIAKMPLKS